MKDAKLNVRISSERLAKLRRVAASRQKTMTQLIENWIDKLAENVSILKESDQKSGS